MICYILLIVLGVVVLAVGGWLFYVYRLMGLIGKKYQPGREEGGIFD